MTAVRLGLRRAAARAGVRLAIVQGAVIVAAFLLAGLTAGVAIDRLETAAVRDRVEGEARSLVEEYRQRGAGHLPHTIEKRTRVRRGFAYRLTSPAGVHLGGLLPLRSLGWTREPGRLDAADPAARPYLVFTQALPDGSRLAVGQDLTAQVRQGQALQRVLLLSGACGVLVCVAASTAFSLHAWRRVARMAQVARGVHEGGFDLRARAPKGPVQDDIDDLAVAFNAMLDRTQVLMAQIRQVTVDIAHDLRTPLTRVQQRLDRLANRVEQQPGPASEVEGVQEELREILRTFDAFLELATIEAPSRERMRRLDLADVALGVADAYRPDIEEGGRTISTDVRPTSLNGSERLLAQATANLIENAMRHTPAGSHLLLEVGRTGGGARLSVSDDGPGVPADRRADVLRPLVQLDESRHRGGSGLGLAIVAAIAARHRAGVHLSDAGPGLRVDIVFPPEPHAA